MMTAQYLLILTLMLMSITVFCEWDPSELRYGDCGYKSELYDCPGTADHRIDPIHSALSRIDIDGVSWRTLRMELVSICGLNNDSTETSHCFADWTHVDCCPIITSHAFNTNEEARIENMHRTNQLGPHIIRNSVPIGSDRNGSWCTCSHGAPMDVCHLQMGSAIAFKVLWCPFMADASASQYIALLVDNDGNLLNYGRPRDQPSSKTKRLNWNIVTNSKHETFKSDMTLLCQSTWRMINREL